MSEWTERHERELAQLENELGSVLQTVMVSVPNRKETQALLDSLLPELDAEDKLNEHIWQQHPKRRPPSLWRQMRTQAKLYGWSFWIGSLVAFVLLTLAMQGEIGLPVKGKVPPLFHFTPLILFASLLYSYRTWDRGMRLVESVTAFPPALVLLSRFLIVLGLDIVLTLVSCAYLLLTAEAGSAVQPFLFILYALAPLAFTFGVVAMTMLYRGIKLGMVLGLVFWVGGFVTPVSELFLTPVSMVAALNIGIVLSLLSFWKGKIHYRLEIG